MSYKLVYTTRAKNELIGMANAIAEHSPEAAEGWFNGFVLALAKLRRDAANYGVAPENAFCRIEVRQFIYKTRSRRANRALYTIRDSTVYIVAIRRPGQDLLTINELNEAIADLDRD